MRRLSTRVLRAAHIVHWLFVVTLEAFEGMEVGLTTKRGHLA